MRQANAPGTRGGGHSERSEGYAFSIREIKQLHQMRKIHGVKMV
jgi:hypothetical protein